MTLKPPDNSNTPSASGVPYLTKTGTYDNNTLTTGQIAFNGGSFTRPYDTDLWIAGAIRSNPTLNSQGMYIQHRVAGDLGTLVNDAAAAELRLSGVSNTGAGQSAMECSLVVTGGVNAGNKFFGLVSNFHTEGSPTGSVSEVTLLGATAVPALAAGFTITTLYGLKLDAQTVGDTNYSIWAPDGISVFGPIAQEATDEIAVEARGLSGTSSTQELLAVKNSGLTTLFRVTNGGAGGFGGSISGPTFWVNNNLATGGTVGMTVRGHSSQSADLQRWQSSAGSTYARINFEGQFITAKTAAPADGDLSAGEMALWFDSTNGAAKLKVKGKSANGTVVSGEVALA